MKRIRFGVWGCGRMGARHGTYYAMEKDRFEPVAACDTDGRRLESVRAEWRCSTYTDAKAFLADPAMELVVISTLSLDHTRHAVEALERGKAVLLDKPIAVTDRELETLRAADRKYPGKFFVLHNLRFEPGFETVQKILAGGKLGAVHQIKLRRHLNVHFFRSDWQTLLEYGGGLLNNWGNHEIDHAVQLLGSHPVEVWSRLWHISAGGTGDDHGKIVLRTADGRIADLEMSYNVTVPEPYCTVYGRRGSLVCPDSMRREATLRYIDPEFPLPEIRIEKDTAVYGNPYEKNVPWVEETVRIGQAGDLWEYIDRRLIRHLYDAVVNGIPSPIRNDDAFETVRIMQEVKKQNPGFPWIMDPAVGAR
jgi:scyllo-inositol 2-dehydrogenase (NADP+)